MYHLSHIYKEGKEMAQTFVVSVKMAWIFALHNWNVREILQNYPEIGYLLGLVFFLFLLNSSWYTIQFIQN